MKKIILAALTVALLLPLIGIGASAASAPWVYDFSTEDAFEYLYDNNIDLSSLYDCDIEFDETEGALKMISMNGPEESIDEESPLVGDPYFSMSALNEDYEELDADVYTWGAICIKNPSEATHFEFHFNSDIQPLTANCCSHVEITPKSEEFKIYVFKVSDANELGIQVNVDADNENITVDESVWGGMVNQIRLDMMWKGEPSGQMPSDSVMFLKWMAFFETEADAKAFTGPSSSPSTTTDAPQATEPTETDATATQAAEATGGADESGTPTGTTADTEGGEDDGTTSRTLYIVLGCVAGVLLIAVIAYAVIKVKGKGK